MYCLLCSDTSIPLLSAHDIALAGRLRGARAIIHSCSIAAAANVTGSLAWNEMMI